MQFLARYAYAPTVSATFSYDCAPFYTAVHDPMIALKTMRRKRAMCFRQLGNYLFRQKCIEHVERTFFSSPQMTQTKRRKKNLKKKKKKKKEEKK